MDGVMGSCPDWYIDAQAAKWLGIPVPEIVNVPLFWRDAALKAISAEHEAMKIKEQRKK